MILETVLCSSLEKIFPDETPALPEYCSGSALQDEVFSFQLAYRSNCRIKFSMTAESPLDVTVREVGLTPCEYPADDHQESPYLLRTAPGLYPDVLLPADSFAVIPEKQWRSFWITVKVKKDETPGRKIIKLHYLAQHFYNDEPEISGEKCFELDVLPAALPEQTLFHTEWFHADCIYHHAGISCWSEKHWQLLGEYFKNFAAHGFNTLLTPLWTPPLDTAVGGERPTVQLLDIEKNGSTYTFDFSRLERWIDLALAGGVRYFEMSHPFSQWGAKFCPKVMVRENGTEKKLFGWHTESLCDEYVDFLRQLFPQLLAFLHGKGLKGRCFFHVSDEPHAEHLEIYGKAAKLIRELTQGEPVIDALSILDFYKQDYVRLPVPSNNRIEPFVEAGVKPLWTYYCCSQQAGVSNRFFNYPACRTRMLGVQLYKYDLAGFLHWGYNFWYSQYSVDQDIDPYRVSDAGRSFPSGDAFLVYPGKDGPVDSLRNELIREAMQDLRALRAVEEKIGREKTLALVEKDLEKPISMTDYPRSAAWLLDLRERVNRLAAAE